MHNATTAAELDAWLRSGGRVVAASERAARAVLASYHRQRRAEGLAAWLAPDVLSWQSFIRQEWERGRTEGILILNARQEQALWSGFIHTSRHQTSLLPGPLHRLAELCMKAHGLLCAYAPQLLDSRSRRGWPLDAGVFSEWLELFDAECRAKKLIGAERIAGDLASLLLNGVETRPALLLAGFDRLTPSQERLFNAWGEWSLAASGDRASDVRSYAAADPATELTACARWCRTQLDVNPATRMLVITQETQNRRGELERAFLRESVPAEFSLGVPLGTIGISRTAALLLHWLDSSLNEHEIDWLFAAPYVGSASERAALQAFHRQIRRRNLQRPQWTLDQFLVEKTGAQPPESWARRMRAARQHLLTEARRVRKPLEWAELVPELLRETGWPGEDALASGEFQAMRRWEQVLAACGSLGFDGQLMEWRKFLSELDQELAATLFTSESEDAPVLIAGPAESAGIAADGVWFLGVDDDAWPSRGSLNPLLPPEVQRAAQMPHATAQQDRELAQTMTERILRSAPTAHFSYARLKDGVERRASRLLAKQIADLAVKPEPLPEALTHRAVARPQTERIVDTSQIPLRTTERAFAGGATVVTMQSLCPFQAFAVERLSAEKWDAAQAGLTALIRGNLLHEVMSLVWGGAATKGIRTLAELKSIPDLPAYVANHVHTAMRSKLPAGARERMPARYLELEERRLTRLVTEWLRYELRRQDFSVDDVELKHEITVAGLTLRVRLDRVDRLNDDSLLVIDYKTGDQKPNQWDLPRPEDAQLPLYAGFALPPNSKVGGLVFAKVRTGEKNMGFAGRITDAKATLLAELNGTSSLIKNHLTLEQLDAWRAKIEQLAQDFLAGRADVDPREIPKTCEKCGLHALCRIHETAAYEGAADEEEDADE
ncbi:PD-(D/E)XK nuclease family protein [Terracidiphilus sp.]|jgi:probable DNA repair protein|uniref:PD-(D/E)XK nuclease family protein n=1 Tax=Terracidiphilus sp. TaxID=1964191 RepID=UPI003C1CA28D